MLFGKSISNVFGRFFLTINLFFFACLLCLLPKESESERKRQRMYQDLPITPHNPHFIIDSQVFSIPTSYICSNRSILLFV